MFTALVLAVPGQAEWFDQGKVAYKTPYKKWRPAAIHVEHGKIEVYNRKDRVLVAEFTEAANVEPNVGEDGEKLICLEQPWWEHTCLN